MQKKINKINKFLFMTDILKIVLKWDKIAKNEL